MSGLSRCLPIECLREIARERTYRALRGYEITSDMRDALALDVLIQGDDRVFQLFLPGAKPEDGRILTRVIVNAVSGEAGPVEVYLQKKRM